jgi:histidinol-phosphatase
VREAGGTVTDADGTGALDTLSVIATNGLLHDAVLARLTAR